MPESDPLEHCYPTSFVSNNDEIATRLRVLSNNTLLDSVRRFCACVPSGHRTKAGLTKLIMDDFGGQTNKLMHLSTENLYKLVSPQLHCPKLQLPLVCQLMHNRYGTTIACHLLCEPTRWNPPELIADDTTIPSVNWLQTPVNQLKFRLSNVDLSTIKVCCDLYLSPGSPPKSKTGRYGVVAERFRARSLFLLSLSDTEFLKNYLTLLPSDLPAPDVSRQQLVEDVLREEFGREISEQLLLPPSSERKNEKQRQARRENQMSSIIDAHETRNAYINSWPQPVPKDVVLECVNAYYEATQLKILPTCCVCSRQQLDVEMHQISLPGAGDQLPDYLSILSVKGSSPFSEDEFQFTDSRLNGLMLDSDGILTDMTSGDTKLCVCHPCYTYLPRSSMPRFALANKLYRGQLPEEFRDLTWIEERVCAIYSNTAVVTRLYQSSDPSQPTVFHGNTCAHEMNVSSTATVLPLAPSSIDDLLSVVFIGSRKFKPEYLGNMYRIRKLKVWRFLKWLREHNQLYLNVSLDESAMDLYPEDGYLPGIENVVIHDHQSDTEDVFKEETAGISEHPAELLGSSSDTSESELSVMIEKMGITDPECDRMPGRLFTAAALRNLVSDGSELPDLVLHRGSTAVSEYSNPNLVPGMYPTLFPAGTGGFEIPDRVCTIAFDKQARYYLDLKDRSFRYHHSFLFVVLNIIQRRTAHLQTHFTVRRSKFETVASKLITVKSNVLQSVADHLEREGKYKDLTHEQKDALDLLKHVNTIAARIPGSQATKVFMRNEIRSYCGFFGLPHLYITLNPNATHSPIFQFMFGDETVDLSKRFPILVSARDRALRLAKDPVAGADFFNFCITSIFRYLFGWDYDKRESTPSGGILGKLESFYGSSEFTERGMLHGHFLSWLLGGLNPAEIHNRMHDDDDFQRRFFAFFEDIIHHHLPEIDAVEADKSFEPRIERPPHPPPPNATLETLNEWESVFCTQIKMCGEVLQRHECRKVCHKYGNDDRCRFLFPHEIVETSHFDPETNSIFLLVRDGTVNYFNPYLLIFCRHNHDIKCILSGKAAKAAMFYITDYITKSDLKTHEMLSLLSRAVANLSDSPDNNESPVVRSKRLLHKCLSQFTRQQQIHAQQAARYLRGLGDSIPSHKTIPMLSALLISYVTKITQTAVPPTSACDQSCTDDINSDGDTDEDEYNEEERENVALKILVNRDGTLRESNQVVDYLYRGETLHLTTFYDFCRCAKLEKTSTSKTKNTANTRLGVLTRHELKQGHPLAETHRIVEHTNELRGEKSELLVPRVMGMSIPRKSDKGYRMFALAHFIPFDIDDPLLKPGQTVDDVFEDARFTDRHLQILNNWEAIHECQDERDAERMRRRAEQSRESRVMTRALHGSIEAEYETEIGLEGGKQGSARDLRGEAIVDLMRQCHWIQMNGQPQTQDETRNTSVTDGFAYPEPTVSQLKEWTSSIKQQEKMMMARRRNANDVGEQVDVHETETLTVCLPSEPPSISEAPVSATEAPKQNTTASSVAETVRFVAEKFSLNEKQKMVYNIIAQKFVNQHVLKVDDGKEPLRMLMTGPGGTGKTHAVRALQELMKLHNSEHLIRFLGPTGTSAKQIGGMTIHKGLGLSISLKSNGRSSRKAGESNEDFTVGISVKNRTLIREEWRHALWLFTDEVSLLGAQLLAQMDHALRYAKEKDEYFGGINVIFAGDFYQYPPVGNTPLYTPIRSKAPQNVSDIEKRLGRLAWKSVDTVISLNEQQRMKRDPEYAAAVGRLRIRECNLGDVELFNERIVKSTRHPNGLDMTSERQMATMLVGTNFIRELLNNSKAKSACTGELIYCAAHDVVDGAEPTLDERKRLLGLNLADFSSEGALPGLIPLFVGMPVILRNRNISTELGITNGSQGIVRKIFTEPCTNNYSVAKCVIVEFPDGTAEVPDLPSHCFPLTPTTWKFNTILNDTTGGKRNVHVSRSQLNLQPAFAITGHAAQGKTLPQVLVDLSEGGFAAYVSASRAQTREGLFITDSIVLDDLNKPVNSDLRQECRRLERLEHNTKIHYGFETGDILALLDPEGEADITLQDPKTRAPKSTPTLDTAAPQMDFDSLPPIPNSQHTANDHINDDAQLPLAGCVWLANSCAYDTFFMLMFSMYKDSSQAWRQVLTDAGPWFTFISEMFEYLMIPANLSNPSCFSKCRDDLRSMLSVHDDHLFPRPSQEHTSIFQVFEAFENNSNHSQTLSQVFACDRGCFEKRNALHLPGACQQSVWTNAARRVNLEYGLDNASIQIFIDLQIAAKIRRGSSSQCDQCNSSIRTSSVFLSSPSSWLFIRIPPGVHPRPEISEVLEIRGETGPINYRLFGIVYYNGRHFVGTWVNRDGSCWGYDGLARHGRPERLEPMELTTLREYSACEIHIALYVLEHNHTPLS